MEDETRLPLHTVVQFRNFENFCGNVQRSEPGAVPKVAGPLPKRNARDRHLPTDGRLFSGHHLW